ncbi:MAG: Hpt domain-containing protein, partial [Gemmataceae bacterium]|nr:Hpt domain-containing protein [Gemmataceae bacterium]
MSGRDEDDPVALFSDYVAECEEHLTSAGRVLLDLEVAPAGVERAQLDGLFRNFHTVKGLSGMVGLEEAERLAHHLEGYLGAVRRGRVALSPDGVAVLVEGVKSLERMIAARGAGLPVPPVDALVGQVARLLPDEPPESAGATAPQPLPSEPPSDPYARANAAIREGAGVWRVRFAPSPERTERGLTVNA